jgi:hypothetical protein
MEAEYKSIYNSLCCDSHNNLRSLVNRHLKLEEDNLSVVFYKAYNTDDTAIYVCIIAEILVKSTEIIHQFFNTDAQFTVREHRQELSNLYA